MSNNKIQGSVHRDSIQPLLHRLDPNGYVAACGIYAVALSNAVTDGDVITQTAKCASCFQGQRFTDVHTGHCCRTHGCKYSDSWCTVTRGVAPEEQPCGRCVEASGFGWQYGIRAWGQDVVDDVTTEDRADVYVRRGSHEKVRRLIGTWQEVDGDA